MVQRLAVVRATIGSTVSISANTPFPMLATAAQQQCSRTATQEFKRGHWRCMARRLRAPDVGAKGRRSVSRQWRGVDDLSYERGVPFESSVDVVVELTDDSFELDDVEGKNLAAHRHHVSDRGPIEVASVIEGRHDRHVEHEDLPIGLRTSKGQRGAVTTPVISSFSSTVLP